MEISNPVSFLIGLITLASAMASVSAILRTGYYKTTIEALKENNAAFEETIEILKETNAELMTRVSSLETENTVLRSLKSGTEAIAKLATAAEEQNKDRRNEHQTLVEGIQAQQELYSQLHEEILSLIIAQHDEMISLIRKAAS